MDQNFSNFINWDGWNFLGILISGFTLYSAIRIKRQVAKLYTAGELKVHIDVIVGNLNGNINFLIANPNVDELYYLQTFQSLVELRTHYSQLPFFLKIKMRYTEHLLTKRPFNRTDVIKYLTYIKNQVKKEVLV